MTATTYRAAVLALWCLVGSAAAHDHASLDVHGAAAMGYVNSSGNNVLGSSLNGSNDLFEVALNARTSLLPELLVAGQLMARKAGSADDGTLRLDYLQLDYQLWQSLRGNAGIRLGKLKNPVGFFNDSRDVVFSRPGILLPSVYLEETGIRDLLFASEGAQGYGHWEFGPLVSSLVLGWGRDRDTTDELLRVLGPTDIEGKVEIDDIRVAQWVGDWYGGGVRTALSYYGAGLRLRAEAPTPDMALDADLWVLSLQKLWSAASLTAEYRLVDTVVVSAGSRSQNAADAAYVQYRHQVGPAWAGYVRYDLNFTDRNDRDGRDAAESGQAPRHRFFSRDHVLGMQWTPTANWGVFAEYHYVDGTAGVRQQDNPGRELARYWDMLLVMVAYQF